MPLYCACPEKTHLSTSRQRPKKTSVISKRILSMPSLYFLSSPILPHDCFTSKRRLRTYATGVHNCFKWLAELRLRSSWSQVWSYDTSSGKIVFCGFFCHTFTANQPIRPTRQASLVQSSSCTTKKLDEVIY